MFFFLFNKRQIRFILKTFQKCFKQIVCLKKIWSPNETKKWKAKIKYTDLRFQQLNTISGHSSLDVLFDELLLEVPERSLPDEVSAVEEVTTSKTAQRHWCFEQRQRRHLAMEQKSTKKFRWLTNFDVCFCFETVFFKKKNFFFDFCRTKKKFLFN